ncbi:MAG: PKD domain-containing protein [Bacteroidota bacterium]
MNKGLPLLLLVYVCSTLFASKADAQVNADFSVNNRTGCGSLQASFSDRSSSTAGNIVSWSWDLGGVASSSRNPGRIFGTPGLYTICLTVRDSEGNEDTECKDDYIHVLHLPTPEFTATPEQGCSPLDVTFSDQSTSIDGEIVQWIWGLGGSAGVVVTENAQQDVQSTYSVPDNFTISLTLIDENNCTNTLTRPDMIFVSPDPEISATARNTSGCEPPLIVDFINNTDTTNLDFVWDFGNGSTFNGAHPPPTVYSAQGIYSVIITAENRITGCQDTFIMSDIVDVGDEVSFTASAMSGCEDLEVRFVDTSPDQADSVRWGFGNGVSGEGNSPSYTYETPGCYFVTLTRWVNGCMTTYTMPECIEVFAIPQANYSNDNPIGCDVPHTVNFAGSAPGATQWSWDFGDNQSSTEQNPTHIYTEFGTFPVSLTVTNANGCTHTIATDTIRVVPLEGTVVSPRFFGCSPLEVTLESSATTVAPITDWEWIVSNSASSPPVVLTSTDTIPTFTLVDTGRYQITLILTNEAGCIDTTVVDGLIGVGIPPVVNFDADPRVSCITSPIQFTDLSSPYTDEWFWEFGEGGESDAQNPMYEYADTGYYSVTLTAFHLGCANELTIDSFIFIDPPKAGFVVQRDCNTPYSVTMNDMAIGYDRIYWNFGVEGVSDDTSNISEPTFVYPATGTYGITQIVWNYTTGCTDTVRTTIHITDPDANFTVDTTRGCAPLTLEIDNISMDANLSAWSANGGVFSDVSDREPTITFDVPGRYSDIRLIITDLNNCSDTLTFTDTVFVNGVQTDFVTDPVGGCMPLTVQFTDQSTTTFGNNVEWDWTFGQVLGTSRDTNPVFEFDEPGLHPVVLTVTNDWGCQDTRTFNDVDVAFPIPEFSADTFGCTKHFISFRDESVGRDRSYLWDFGDGNSSTEQNPTHYYQNEGIYTVCLTVSNQIYGCDSTICKQDYVTIADPVAAFSADSTFASCPPLVVNFQNNSLNASTYFWDFGDNSGNSNLESPPHVYTIPGTYDVMLIASSTDNCHDTLLLADYISLDGPIGSFSFDNQQACVPSPITFYGQSAEPYTYIWDYGNGVLDTSALSALTDTLTYVYEEVGSFVPKLILVNPQGCARALEATDTIRTGNLEANFMAMDSILCDNATTTFLNLSNSSHPISFVEWIFEGGTPGSSNAFEPTVSFGTEGSFDVTLMVGNGFCNDTLVMDDLIRVGAVPQASFSATPTAACAPALVEFTDGSSIVNGVIVGWNWDFGDGSSTSEQNPTHLFREPGTYQVTLEVRTQIGCTSTSNLTITVSDPPEVELGDSPVICRGESVQLSANIISTNVTDFFWLPDATLSCTDCLDPWVNPLDTTIYSFVSLNDQGCYDTAQIAVLVRPYDIPVIDIGQDTTICLDNVAFLNAQSNGANDSYAWLRERQGLTCYDCPDPVARPDFTTTYVLTVTNEFDCSSSDSLTVSVIDERQEFASDDRIICEGDTVQLSISMGNDPLWLNTDGLSCGTCPNPMAYPSVSTDYIVRITTDIGCTLYDTVRIEVMHPDDIDAGDSTRICLGETITLQGDFVRGAVSWSPDAFLDNANTIQPEARPESSGYFYLRVSDGDCVLTDSVYIAVQEKVEIWGRDTTICEGESVQIEIQGAADSYYWIPPRAVSDLTSPNPILSPRKTTEYAVLGQLSTCIPDTARVTVNVIPAPEIGLLKKRNVIAGQVIKLNTSYDGLAGYEFEWWPPLGLSCRSCASPAVQIDTTTMYSVVVTDPQTGCTDTAQTIVEVLQACPPELINMPNIFTPNDDGVNDILKIVASPAIETIKSFTIYDRWGAQVFSTNDINAGWDGRLRGVPAHKGVYVYLIEAECPIDGSLIFRSGDVTLLRN